MNASPYLSIERASDPGTDPDVARIMAQVEPETILREVPVPRPIRIGPTGRAPSPPDLRWAPPIRRDVRRRKLFQVYLDASTRAALYTVRDTLAAELKCPPFSLPTVLRITTFCMVELVIAEEGLAIPQANHTKNVEIFSIIFTDQEKADLMDVAYELRWPKTDVVRCGVLYMAAVCATHGPVLEVRVRHAAYEIRKRGERLIYDYLQGLGRSASEEEIAEAVGRVPVGDGWPEGEWI